MGGRRAGLGVPRPGPGAAGPLGAQAPHRPSPSGRGCSRPRSSSWPSARSCSASRGRGSIASAGPPRRPGRGPRRSTTFWSTTCSGRPTRSATPPGRTSPCGSCSTGPSSPWTTPSRRSPASPAWRGRSARPSATPTSGWGSTRRPSSNCPGPMISWSDAGAPPEDISSPGTAPIWAHAMSGRSRVRGGTGQTFKMGEARSRPRAPRDRLRRG